MKFCSRCILINTKKEILLVKHDLASAFTLPGGHIEDGEDPYQALIREIKEELGLDIKIIGKKNGLPYDHIEELPLPLCIQKIQYISPRRGPTEKFEYIFQALVTGGDIQLQREEIVDYKRVKQKDLQKKESDLFVFENIIDLARVITLDIANKD